MQAFERMSGKVQMISTLHKHLSLDEHNEGVPLDVYMMEIAVLYRKMVSEPLAIEVDVQPMEIPSEKIIYFGLVVNELLANTIEHRGTEGPAIVLRVAKAQTGYRFSYFDGSAHKGQPGTGTGSQLIRELIERVGGRSFTFDAATGGYEFEFDG